MEPKNIVLYADDDPDDREMLQTAFAEHTQSHLELKIFSGGDPLLEYVKTLNSKDPEPCLIILDINMPGLNGWETFRQLRKHPITARTEILFLSTSGPQITNLLATEYNATIVIKPVGVDELLHLAEKIISHCSPTLQKRLRFRDSISPD